LGQQTKLELGVQGRLDVVKCRATSTNNIEQITICNENTCMMNSFPRV